MNGRLRYQLIFIIVNGFIVGFFAVVMIMILRTSLPFLAGWFVPVFVISLVLFLKQFNQWLEN